MTPVTCTSTYKPEPLNALEASGPLKGWLNSIPGWATLTPILNDVGSQRDPDTIMVGMKATWVEER